jgi:HD-like signal output (HDOD) protein
VVQAFRSGAADFLLKPFSRFELKEVLARVRRKLGDPGGPSVASGPIGDTPAAPSEEGYEQMRGQMMRTLNSGDFALPVPPTVLSRVISLSQQSAPDGEQAIRTIESEVLLGRAVMKLARSAQFRGHRPPASVREAIARTGVIRALSNAAAAAQRANYEFTDRTVSKLAGRLWLSHFIVALTAEVIGERIEVDRPDRLQTMALFAEVGELVMLRVAAELWPEQLSVEGPTAVLGRVVREHRAKVSAMLLADWGMPADFIVVARWAPPTPLRSVRPEIQHALSIIVLARQLAEGMLGKNPFGAGIMASAEDRRLLPSFSPEVEAEIRREAVDRARAQLGVR